MLLRRFAIACLAVCSVSAAPQDTDRDTRAREYVQFLVLQLDQWRQEFPHRFYLAMMRPPVDAAKMSAGAKAGAGELGDSIGRLAALGNARDLTANAEFRSQVDQALAAARDLNLAMSTQKFPTPLQSDWDQIRSTLNNLARVYKLEMLAVLDAPGGGAGGRGGRGGVVAGGVAGYIVDQSCAKRGKGMWTNNECIAKCLRDGDKIVLVTEEGKIYQISNQDMITPESYGQVVTLVGKADGDTITVDSLKM
jgi:hypothetical protein